MRAGDTLVAWKLDRLGRDLRHLVNPVHELTGRGAGLRVPAGEGAAIDTTTPNGRLMFGFFVTGETLVSPDLAEFERELIIERTKAGLASARARGRNGGRPYKMTPAKLRFVQAAPRSAPRDGFAVRTEGGSLRDPIAASRTNRKGDGRKETKVGELCAEPGITRQTFYRHVDPEGALRPDGRKLLGRKKDAPEFAGPPARAPA